MGMLGRFIEGLESRYVCGKLLGVVDISNCVDSFADDRYVEPYLWGKRRKYVQRYFGVRKQRIPFFGYLDSITEESAFLPGDQKCIKREYGIVYWKQLGELEDD